MQARPSRVPTFQVRQVDSGRGVLRWLLYAALVVPSLLFGYWVGSDEGAPNLSVALARLDMQAKVSERERESERLSAALAIAERSAQVADESAERVRQELMARQDEIRTLRTELAFYRGVLAERGGSAGLRFHRVEPDPANARLEIVLVRGGSASAPARGRIEVRELSPGAETEDFDAFAASQDAAVTAGFDFEYFQRLALHLPEVEPGHRLLVTVRPEGKDARPFHEIVTWPERG